MSSLTMKTMILILLQVLLLVNYSDSVPLQENQTYFRRLDGGLDNFQDNNFIENHNKSNKSEDDPLEVNESASLVADGGTGDLKNISEMENVENRNQGEENLRFNDEHTDLTSGEDAGDRQNSSKISNVVDNRNESEESLRLTGGQGNLTSDEDTGERRNISEVANVESRNQSEEAVYFIDENGDLTSSEDTEDRNNTSDIANVENRYEGGETLYYIDEHGNVIPGYENDFEDKDAAELEGESEYTNENGKVNENYVNGYPITDVDFKKMFMFYYNQSQNQNNQPSKPVDANREVSADEDINYRKHVSAVESNNQKEGHYAKQFDDFSFDDDEDAPMVSNLEEDFPNEYDDFDLGDDDKNVSVILKFIDKSANETEQYFLPLNVYRSIFGGNNSAIPNFENLNRSEQVIPFVNEHGEFILGKNMSAILNFINEFRNHSKEYMLPVKTHNGVFPVDGSSYGDEIIHPITIFENYSKSEENLPFLNENGDIILDYGNNTSAELDIRDNRNQSGEPVQPITMNLGGFPVDGSHDDENVSAIPNFEDNNQNKENLPLVNENDDTILDDATNASKNLDINENRNQSGEHMLSVTMNESVFPVDGNHGDENISAVSNFENNNQSKENFPLVNENNDMILDDATNAAKNLDINENFNQSGESMLSVTMNDNVFPVDGNNDDGNISAVPNFENNSQSKENFPLVNENNDVILDDATNATGKNLDINENRNQSGEHMLPDMTASRNDFPVNDTTHDGDNISAIPNVENHNQTEKQLPHPNENGDVTLDDSKTTPVDADFLNGSRNQSGENLR